MTPNPYLITWIICSAIFLIIIIQHDFNLIKHGCYKFGDWIWLVVFTLLGPLSLAIVLIVYKDGDVFKEDR
jgi:hypothetical protein